MDWTAPHHCTLAIRCRPTSTYLTTPPTTTTTAHTLTALTHPQHRAHCFAPQRAWPSLTTVLPVRPPAAAAVAAAAPYTRFSAPSLQCALRPSASPTTVTADRLPPSAIFTPSTLPPYQLALVHAHTATPWGLPMSQPGAQPFLGESGQGALLDICASACRVTCVSYESPVSWPAKTTLHRRCALPLQVTALTYVLWLLLL